MRQKKLVVLGGTSASLDVVKNAKKLGVYTIVTDDNPHRVAKDIADEKAMVSTSDIEGLKQLVKEREADGIFCGPSEFNIRNMIKACAEADLPCYTDMETWDKCANKDVFKQYCRQYGVDCPAEYVVTEYSTDEDLAKLDYPVIFKPVDRCSSIGISVCTCKEEAREAFRKAMDASNCKRIICEKYIENEGEIFGVRYFLKDGEAYPYLMIDTYVADPYTRTSLISEVTVTPSKYSEYYMKNMDPNVRKMFKGMGLKNGTVFVQALPYQGKIYFHEMGYRLSGGLIFKLTEPLMGINDMQMMIRYAVGGEMITDEERERIDLTCHGRCGGQLMVPLREGKISSIEGLEELKQLPAVSDFIQYYQQGDVVEPEYIGTLQQLFGRFSFIADTEADLFAAIEEIQTKLKVYDAQGAIMTTLPFDLDRARK
jgi:biotin carboxylase